MTLRPVHLCLGSNLGDRAANLRAALAALAECVHLTALSSVWETAPLHVLDQPAFLNLVLAGETGLDGHPLLARLKRIEHDLGRVASLRYGPRLIDIDILCLGEVVREDPVLTLPHPRLAERRFVLAPLAEIAPALVPPGLGRDVAALLAALGEAGGAVRRLGPLESLAPASVAAL
ncbi:MAG: 2-amino-4-hydroxy-6-hydroxymethyldihyropteridine pyrophosphokinae [Pseudomonadota bacterium]|jgi:2-amino-4-hydroxy-6-hydroxymethyldihydropteridine diphosphokinase